MSYHSLVVNVRSGEEAVYHYFCCLSNLETVVCHFVFVILLYPVLPFAAAQATFGVRHEEGFYRSRLRLSSPQLVGFRYVSLTCAPFHKRCSGARGAILPPAPHPVKFSKPCFAFASCFDWRPGFAL